MQSFADIDARLAGQPPRLGALLAQIDTGRGREQLFAEQLPQVLTNLAEATRVASIQASTAIEGYDVSDERADQLARRPDARFRDRNEQEFAGYRDAIDELVRDRERRRLAPSYPFYLSTRLQRYTTGEPGRPKREQNYIADVVGGSRQIVFTPVAPHLTESSLRSLIEGYNEALDERSAHPLLLLGLLVLDFLAIHPLDDGNGRISRLLTVHELLRMDYGVARFVSVEQLIFDSKNSYYDALETSQRNWHDGAHDVWPWLTYFVTVLAGAYERFESRLAAARNATGSKLDQARHYLLEEAPATFRLADASRALPGISDATIRQALNALKAEGRFQAGRGAKAQWRRVDDGNRGVQ